MSSLVRLKFNSTVLPVIQSITDSEPAYKDVVIDGNRGDGSIVIPGGKKSVTISVKGVLLGDSFDDLTDKKVALSAALPTSPGVLSLQQYVNSTWKNVWSYAVKRQGEIVFEGDDENRRLSQMPYMVNFLILSY
jgi:hypothetical protein